MLQPSDETYIARIVAPLSFTLKAGRVSVNVPEGLVAEVRDASGKMVKQPLGGMFSHDEVEKSVNELKRIEKRSEMASNFREQLILLNDVLVQNYQRTGNDKSDDFKNDPEIGPWLAWRETFLVQCETANKPSDVKIPKWPKYPRAHRHLAGSKQLAIRLGHRGPFDTD